MRKVLVEAQRVLLLLEHVEIDVGRVPPPELRDDHRRPDDLLRLEVAEHEDVLALPDVLDLSVEALEARVQDLPDGHPVVRQVYSVKMAGHGEELVFVFGQRGPDLVGRHGYGPRMAPVSRD